MKTKAPIVAAVEIGTSKIKVVIGKAKRRSFVILGHGESPSSGVMKGTVFDFHAASDETYCALQQAEHNAGVRIDRILLAQSGDHLGAFYHEASVKISGPDHIVTADDVAAVTSLARGKALPEGRILIHQIRRPFRLNRRFVQKPEGLTAEMLEVGYWFVHGQENKVADHLYVIRGFNVPVDAVILSSLASGTMVTTAEDRKKGVLVMDIGGGTTDFVLYRDGYAYMTGVLPVGGEHLTNDLSHGLRLTKEQAEKLKLRFGRATITARDKTEKVWLNGDFAVGDRQFSLQAIERITAARIDEIFQAVFQIVNLKLVLERLDADIVLTGGTSKLPGITEAASRVFGTTVRIGAPEGSVYNALCDPSYSTVLGLLHFVNPECQ